MIKLLESNNPVYWRLRAFSWLDKVFFIALYNKIAHKAIFGKTEE